MHTDNNRFSLDIITSQDAEVVFKSVNNVSGWWSQEITGKSEQPGDEFFYHYKDIHSCHIRVLEAVPAKKVVWQVLDNFFRFTKDETEWIGTTIVFDIEQQEQGAVLHFTHIGLGVAYECYEACKDGWTNFIGDSLLHLIEKGIGRPNPREGGFNEQNTLKWKLQQQ